MAISQTGRLLTVSSSLGADVLLLIGFEGEEHLSKLFHFTLNLVSENQAIDPTALLGKPITWTVSNWHSSPRYFNGIVRRFGAGPKMARGLRAYRAEVVPYLWMLGRTTDCRIFQNQAVTDIITTIFGDFGLSDFKKSTTGTYNPLEYCVQYRESAFQFVSRLMEEFGINYSHLFADGKHTLTLADANSAFTDCPEATVEFRADSNAPAHVTSWEHSYEYCSGKWTYTDYNFETPSTNLLANTTSKIGLAQQSTFELFDYPGRYSKSADGTTLTKIRMEAEEVDYSVVRGSGRCCTFFAGGKFTLAKHSDSAENKAYVLTSVRHSASDPSILGGGGEAEYENSFVCIPASVPFRPTRVTPKPIVAGPQTAVVTGPSGEEIYVDKYGRVKVHFFWDRKGKLNENSSCWLRVSENWAGKQWGIVFHPRVGQEVIVDFLEGDPDRPLITGRVYNAEQMPPYALPTNMTQSGIKTRSSKQGDTETFNELRFEDKKGAEDIYFHAQKDFHRYVENDDDLQVLHDQTITIKNNRTEVVQEGNEKITISKGNRDEEVTKGNETIVIGEGNRSITVSKGDQTLAVSKGKRTTTIYGDDSLTVSNGNQIVTVSTGDQTINIDTGNMTQTVKTGDMSLKASAGSITIEAAQKITLKVGSSTLTIEPAAISLASTKISVAAQAQLEVSGAQSKLSGQAQLDLDSPMTKVSGSGMLTLVGGLIKIG